MAGSKEGRKKVRFGAFTKYIFTKITYEGQSLTLSHLEANGGSKDLYLYLYRKQPYWTRRRLETEATLGWRPFGEHKRSNGVISPQLSLPA